MAMRLISISADPGEITRKHDISGLLGSALLIFFACAIQLFFQDQSPVARMFLIIGVLFFGFKILIAWTCPLSETRPAMFFFFWPGMNPQPFRKGTRSRKAESLRAAFTASLYLISGGTLLSCTLYLPGYFLTAATTCVSLSLIVHFGIFGLIRTLYLANGWGVPEMFSRPWNATTFSTFWGRHWNRPFMELSSLLLFRPFYRIFGRDGAIACTFIFSGIVHEMAISLPVGQGYGGPFAYFILHGLLVIFEKRMGPRVPPGVWRLILWAALILPLPWLFHAPFIEQILFPLIGISLPDSINLD